MNQPQSNSVRQFSDRSTSSKARTGQLERKLEQLGECTQAIDKLFQQALEHDGVSAFDTFLDSCARFSNLSVYNAMLVRVQRPGAIAVATRSKWQEVGGRVRPTAIPIIILQPFGPVSFVYERADVDGVKFSGEDANPVLASGSLTESTYRRTAGASAIYGVEIVETDQYGGHLAGTAEVLEHPREIAPKSQTERLWGIRINRRHDLATRFATLVHELGHIYCGHLGPGPKAAWPDRRNEVSSHAQRELEAEATCWLVCNRNGVTSRSKEYLARLITQADVAKVSMFSIFMAANRIEARSR